jgi:hypothetical protein
MINSITKRQIYSTKMGGAMKKILLVSLLVLIIASVFAKQMSSDTVLQTSEIRHSGNAITSTRTPPDFSFSVNPSPMITSYFDYMIGNYNAQPLQLIPESAGGGYFLTFHGKRTATGNRRVFYAHLNSAGQLTNVNEITSINRYEGYPSIGVDPVSGKPLYAWHADHEYDPYSGSSPEILYEVEFTSDAFIVGISGLFNDIQAIIDNPITISGSFQGDTFSSTNNEFIWPTLQIGPSPYADKSRVYVLGRNTVDHTSGWPCESAYIAYADFDGDMLEMGIPLVWSYTSIPEMDWWNHDSHWRRPFHSLTVDNMGNVYYAGFHFATESDGSTNIIEENLDVFMCPNYGEGSWSRVSEFGALSSWNPPDSPGGLDGYFIDSDTSLPFTDEQLYWDISNSGHLNAIVDNMGRVHVIGIWALQNTSGSYYPAFQTVKSFIYNPSDQSISVKEIYPQKNPNDTFNEWYQPWDVEAPWGEADSYSFVDGEYILNTECNLPFPHWDSSLHEEAMYFHYNNLKLSKPNSMGQMVAVWQDSQRAKDGIIDPDLYPESVPYTTGPEIMIATSMDNGNTWMEPIRLNAVDNPELAGMIPMWVYPANEVIYAGQANNGNLMGRIGLMFYDDNTWGSYAITPPAHVTNDGGRVMFTELMIEFSPGDPVPEDPFAEPMVLSGSMTLMAGVLIDSENAQDGDILAAFVDVDSVPQLRGKSTVELIDGVPGCLMQIYTETDGETIYFRIWDQSVNQVLDCSQTLISEVNATVGSWPDNLYWINTGNPSQQSLYFTEGWNMISTNMHPDLTDTQDVFAGILNHLLILKSPDGVFQPGNPYNSLTQIEDGKGYYAKVSSNCVLTIQGNPIDPATPIALQAGWNLVAFTPQMPISVAGALSSIATNLVQVKGIEGVYEPGNPYNTLASLSPGRAYWMKLLEPANLVYTPGRSMAKAQSFPFPEEKLILKSNSQTALLGFEENLPAGSVITAWVDEELRGITDVINANGKSGALLQIYTEETGEQIDFKLRDVSGHYTSLNPGLQSKPGGIVGDYSQSSFLVLDQTGTQSPQLVTSLHKAYPNPFGHGTSISLSVAKQSPQLELAIYNVKGQKIRTLIQGKQDSGNFDLWWDGMDDRGNQMPSGLYFCRLKDANRQQSIKLMLVK